jgi:hypothetical protein
MIKLIIDRRPDVIRFWLQDQCLRRSGLRHFTGVLDVSPEDGLENVKLVDTLNVGQIL